MACLLLLGVDLGRHVDPRQAWMFFVQSSKNSISIEIHPRMAWIYRDSLRLKISPADPHRPGMISPRPWRASLT
ncbi:hypothetical protein DBR33_09400 [Stenotrophomonas sp. HMWF022]|nr:hypothetical protein DBR33_09400 [Stenotrophomonas sp. HMWF022]